MLVRERAADPTSAAAARPGRRENTRTTPASAIPPPIICQSLDAERTGVKNTRLTTSGTSMPVSSVSTEMAMCGAASAFEKSSMTECASEGARLRRHLPDHDELVDTYDDAGRRRFGPGHFDRVIERFLLEPILIERR